MKRASVWDVMRRALRAPPRWTRVWASGGGGIGYLQLAERTPTLGMHSARSRRHAGRYQVPPVPGVERGAWSMAHKHEPLCYVVAEANNIDNEPTGSI